MNSNLLKKIIGKCRNVASRLLLRGPVFRFWVGRKVDRLVIIYHKQLIQTADRKTSRTPAHPVAASGRERLEKLLFITDAMWEKRELLPELSRICDVTFADVHTHIHQDDGGENLPLECAAALLEPFQNIAYDCIIVYLRSSLLSEEFIQFLRSKWKCPLVGLNLDCKTTFADYKIFRREPDGYRHWAGKYDCNLTNARAMLDVYAASGFNCLYLPTGYHFDSAIHRAPDGADFEIPISFIGSCKPERKIVVDQLRRAGIDVKTFGGGWDGQGFVEDGWRIYRQSQLNLGIGYNVPDARFTNLKNRDFECPGAGGCYLTMYDWELAGLFDIGREILCYRSVDDLVELYSYYIRRPEECLKIGAAGFERCRREHTWEHRFRKVFQQLGFKPAKEFIVRG